MKYCYSLLLTFYLLYRKVIAQKTETNIPKWREFIESSVDKYLNDTRHIDLDKHILAMKEFFETTFDKYVTAVWNSVETLSFHFSNWTLLSTDTPSRPLVIVQYSSTVVSRLHFERMVRLKSQAEAAGHIYKLVYFLSSAHITPEQKGDIDMLLSFFAETDVILYDIHDAKNLLALWSDSDLFELFFGPDVGRSSRALSKALIAETAAMGVYDAMINNASNHIGNDSFLWALDVAVDWVGELPKFFEAWGKSKTEYQGSGAAMMAEALSGVLSTSPEFVHSSDDFLAAGCVTLSTSDGMLRRYNNMPSRTDLGTNNALTTCTTPLPPTDPPTAFPNTSYSKKSSFVACYPEISRYSWSLLERICCGRTTYNITSSSGRREQGYREIRLLNNVATLAHNQADLRVGDMLDIGLRGFYLSHDFRLSDTVRIDKDDDKHIIVKGFTLMSKLIKLSFLSIDSIRSALENVEKSLQHAIDAVSFFIKSIMVKASRWRRKRINISVRPIEKNDNSTLLVLENKSSKNDDFTGEIEVLNRGFADSCTTEAEFHKISREFSLAMEDLKRLFSSNRAGMIFRNVSQKCDGVLSAASVSASDI